MGRGPCCDKIGLNKGSWTAEEDQKLSNFILSNHQCSWREVPKYAGLLRCGKSCRLRWVNYLRPDLKRGLLSEYEEKLFIHLHFQLGNKWSKIASHMPGRTDNEIKNLWHTHVKKKVIKMGIDPLTHRPFHAHPSMNNNHQDHDRQSQDKGEENDGISIKLDESVISTNTADDHLAKQKVAIDISISKHELPFTEPDHDILPNPDLPASCSSTTSCVSTTNSIFEDLKLLPSFEDWQSDGYSGMYIENTGFTYENDFTDWDRLLYDFDIHNIDHQLFQSLPHPANHQLWS